MIKLRKLLETLSIRRIPVVVGIIDLHGNIRSELSKMTHDNLGFYKGKRWRYNPETKNVYWGIFEDDWENEIDQENVNSHLLKKYNYKVDGHTSNAFGKNSEIAHGLMQEHKFKLLFEQTERKYILPPDGDIFQVQDHIGWAINGVLKSKYKYLADDLLDAAIDQIYEELRSIGYLTLVWMGASDELYVRIDNLGDILPSQMRKINHLVDKLIDEGIYYQVKMTDNYDREQILWTHPSIDI
jgi:hypothetical protein